MATRTKRKKERRRGRRREGRNEGMKQLHSGGSEWSCISIPEGLEVFKPEALKTPYHIDVIPYIVGTLNPNKAVEEGDEYWELSYPIYKNIGIEERRYVAIGPLTGGRDPVAEHFAMLRKTDAEWDDMKVFKHTWRQLMLIFVHEEAEKGLQLYEGAFGTFGELLKEELDVQAEDYDWIDNFDDPDHGATLVVRFKSKNIGGKNPWILAGKLDFEEREDGFTANGDAKLAEEILDQVEGICLDDCLKVPDYDTLKAALDGMPVDDDEEPEVEPEPEPKRSRSRSKAKPKTEPEDEDWGDDPFGDDGNEPEPEPEPKKSKGKRKAPTATDLGIEKGGMVEHDEFGTCSVVRVAKNGLTVTIMDGDDNVHKGIDPTDLEPIETAEPEVEAEKPKGKGKKETTAEGDEWDSDWD